MSFLSIRMVGTAILTAVVVAATACGSSGSSGPPPSNVGASPNIAVPPSLSEAGVLNIAAFLQFPPYRFLDGAGRPQGVEVELANAVAGKLGVKAQFQNVAFDTIIPGVSNHRYDFSLGTFYDVPARTEQVDILDWIEVTSRMVVQSGNPRAVDPTDPCGLSIGGSVGGYQIEQINQISANCEKAGKPPTTQMVLQDFSAALQALRSGRVDAVLADAGPGDYFAKQSNDTLEVLTQDIPGIEKVAAGWAFAKDSGPVRQAVVAAIKELIAEGTWTEILDRSNLADLAVNPPSINRQPVGE